jgi:hypothetical protein
MMIIANKASIPNHRDAEQLLPIPFRIIWSPDNCFRISSQEALYCSHWKERSKLAQITPLSDKTHDSTQQAMSPSKGGEFMLFDSVHIVNVGSADCQHNNLSANSAPIAIEE